MKTRQMDTAWCLTFNRLLGNELRTARDRLRWTRPDLHHQLYTRFGLDISTQTLATYELSTRSVSAARLAQICIVLNIDVRDVHDRVLERMHPEPQHRWILDLVAASQLEDDDLMPLRRWARCRLDESTHARVRIQIESRTLAVLAYLCHLNTTQLARRLPHPRTALTHPAHSDPDDKADIP